MFGCIAQGEGAVLLLIGFAFHRGLADSLHPHRRAGRELGPGGHFPADLARSALPLFRDGIVLALIVALLFVERSNLGWVFVAIRDNGNVVRSLGIPVFMTKGAVLRGRIGGGRPGGFGACLCEQCHQSAGFRLHALHLRPGLSQGGRRGQPAGAHHRAVLLVGIASYAQTLRATSTFYGLAIIVSVLFMPKGPDGPVQESLRGPHADRINAAHGAESFEAVQGLLAVSGVDIRIARGRSSA